MGEDTREYRVVCLVGRVLHDGLDRLPTLEQAVQSADGRNRWTQHCGPHRVQYRDIPVWRDLPDAASQGLDRREP